MRPTVRRLEEEFKDKVDFKVVDIDMPQNDALMKKLKFLGHPQFVVLGASQQVLSSRNGFQDYATLKKDLEAALAVQASK